MYSTREAMAYSGKLPEQQQSGITPDLIDLLAMQKVEDDKKAAASQMALAAGQPMPTIAESLKQKALASAKQEIAQKLGLSAALAQQQAPQGQAAMPPQATTQQPQQAPQQAPQQPSQAAPQQPQGVAAVQSNLPKSYAHGGILHYVTGGEAGMREQIGDVSQLADSPDQVQQVIDAIQSGKLQGPERQAAMEYLQSISNKSAGGGRGFVNPGMEPPTKQVAGQALDRFNSPQNFAYSTAQDRVVLNPEEQGLQSGIIKSLQSNLALNPSQARTGEENYFKNATNEHFQQAQQAKQEGLAALQALYAKDQANRPSQFWQTINAIGAKGPNVQPGQWGAGVAEKVQGQNEAYSATDIARQKNINDLNAAMNEALAKNDVDIYNAGRNEFVRTAKQLGDSTHDAVTYIDSMVRFKTSDADRMARIASEEKTRGEISAATKAKADEDRELRRRALAQKAFDDDLEAKGIKKKLENPYMLPPNETPDLLNQRLEQIYRRKHQEYGVPLPPSENAGKPGSKENPIKLG